ncbi:hypothetical protein BX616_010169 [Lobosporangium transversale]|uniref:Uncharacterized protein n=1 Tax=Lobosporangium transversale TaxID=64571 RepID=A0A1Y2GSP1_9FUNG|nr:hypothetical protein BCR41DRAFT_420736 [Lobosporangium transversale]KAF9913079.1 hypothetical protein BX616_010169 [Lobosporangium transversale]ORZ21802.1 hypothetical protein BCR41DRAFT_420736 [Lobosporangium transversale]|eukprot:XP_021883053.1 hypothetical protein BCR41DRAFT_420736 [Lobosporangium transversale]
MPKIPLNVLATLPRKLGPAPKRLPVGFRPTEADARSLYRQLWRTGSLSVMYTNPGTKVIRQKLREAFEEAQQKPKTIDADIRQQWERAYNTRFFFEIASTRFGVEHSVISNITRIAAENSSGPTHMQKSSMRQAQKEIDKEYNKVISALNESMGLSLR